MLHAKIERKIRKNQGKKFFSGGKNRRILFAFSYDTGKSDEIGEYALTIHFTSPRYPQAVKKYQLANSYPHHYLVCHMA